MRFPLFACALLLLAVVACEAPYKKSDAAEKKARKDMSNDPSFQAFVGRLRIAVSKHDRTMLASMMTTDFGYRWDNPTQPELAFDYWDQRNLWEELSKVLHQKFGPNDNYMVAPAQVISDRNYAGYRAGLRMVRGSWKFAYFVPAPPANAGPEPPVSPLPGEPVLGAPGQ